MITLHQTPSFKGNSFKGLFHLLCTLLVPIGAPAQTQVSLKDKISSPEVYMMVKLQDTILAAREGFAFENFASVRFQVDKNGNVGTIEFSIYTDSLVMPHLIHALRSTDGKWRITRKGKLVKETVTVLLPVVFDLKARLPLQGKTEEDPLAHPPLELVGEGMQMLHFSKSRESNYYLYLRSEEKFEGIVLNPILIRVPQGNDQRY